MSISRESGGATVGPRGARSNPHALWDMISSYNTPECGGNAGVPDGLRAAETAFVHLCLQLWATVDTTPENDKLLQEHYATATRQELMRIFPDRPVSAIYRHASTLHLKKTKEDRECGKLAIAEDLSLMDYEVMEQYGLCWKNIQNDQAQDYTGLNNGGEHGVYFVCLCGQSGLFIGNDAA